jgi:hypothetical protein
VTVGGFAALREIYQEYRSMLAALPRFAQFARSSQFDWQVFRVYQW